MACNNKCQNIKKLGIIKTHQNCNYCSLSIIRFQMQFFENNIKRKTHTFYLYLCKDNPNKLDYSCNTKDVSRSSFQLQLSACVNRL